MARNIIITVGTSLLENPLIESTERARNTLNNFLKENRQKKEPQYITHFPEFLEAYCRGFENLESEVKKRFEMPGILGARPRDCLAAELSSLFLFYYKIDGEAFSLNKDNCPNDGEKDKIYLIYSDTNESHCCAGIIRSFLIENKNFTDLIGSVESRIIKDLHLGGDYELNSKGIDNFINECAEIIKDGDVVNISGGYKALGPYLTILSMCFIGTRVFYLYENAKEVVELPYLPINLDVLLWRDYRGITALLPQISAISKEVLKGFLPPASLRGLFAQKSASNWELNSFGKILKKRYDESKAKITEFGAGFLLAERLKNIDNDLGEKLEGLIQSWQHLWLGDMLRETVEHARGHVQRNQEIAAQIIFQMLEKNNNFIKADELLRLICTIWLHDIGHCAEHFKFKEHAAESKETEYIFPSFSIIIRDLHHFISSSLIEQEKEFLFQGLLTDKDIEDIRTICLYHRKDVDTEYGFKCQPFEEIEENLQFLIALFSLIDESDVCQERAFPENYQRWREQQNWRESKILRLQYKALDRECKRKIETELSMEDIEICLDDLAGAEAVEKLDKAILVNLKTKFEAGFFTIEKFKEDISTEALSILSRFCFKMRQAEHFKKHKGILSVCYVLNLDQKFDLYLSYEGDYTACQTAAKEIYMQYLLRAIALNKRGFFLNNEGIYFISDLGEKHHFKAFQDSESEELKIKLEEINESTI